MKCYVKVSTRFCHNDSHGNEPLISAKASANRVGIFFGPFDGLNKATGITVYESIALTRSTVLVTEDWSRVEPNSLSGILDWSWL